MCMPLEDGSRTLASRFEDWLVLMEITWGLHALACADVTSIGTRKWICVCHWKMEAGHLLADLRTGLC